MNWMKVCTVGLKVLLAVGTGFAVFAGVEQAVKSSKNNVNNPNPGNGGWGGDANNQMVPVVQDESTCGKIVTGLKATQDTCGKIVTVLGSITTAAECISNIFRGGNTYDDYGYGYGMNNPYQQPYYGAPNDGHQPRLYRHNRYIQVCY